MLATHVEKMATLTLTFKVNINNKNWSSIRDRFLVQTLNQMDQGIVSYEIQIGQRSLPYV